MRATGTTTRPDPEWRAFLRAECPRIAARIAQAEARLPLDAARGVEATRREEAA